MPAGALHAVRDWNKIKTWVYQLTDYKDEKLEEMAGSGFDLAVIDLARDGGGDYFTQTEINSLKQKGMMVLAYFEIGAIENYRPESDQIPADIKLGPVQGWPDEQYVRYWDERWWPVIKARIDRALKAGFDGAYLDMIVTYEEIPEKEMKREKLAEKMVDLIAGISSYAKSKNPDFKIVPQNNPELYTWSFWDGQPSQKYINAIDAIGMEELYYLAHDKPCNKGWCRENRDNTSAIRKAGKLVLTVDYAKKPENIADAYSKSRSAGFVPYVSVKALNVILKEELIKKR